MFAVLTRVNSAAHDGETPGKRLRAGSTSTETPPVTEENHAHTTYLRGARSRHHCLHCTLRHSARHRLRRRRTRPQRRPRRQLQPVDLAVAAAHRVAWFPDHDPVVSA